MSVETKPDFEKMEHDVLNFWEEHRCFDKLREKNKGNKRFRFLDGPITANNPMGIHHAWGRSIKDIVLRYKAMNGYSCHYRNGFDTQGLWVEVEVEKELGFKDKKDTESYGMGNFTNKCVERIHKYSAIITEQSKRLGQWMDWDNAYYTHTDQNITAIWYFLKVCNENGWITQKHRPMPWCPRCGTSLSEHEMAGSHKELTHTAVFAKLPVAERDFDILVWTTTPWTLSANVALAVNPDLDYAVVKLPDSERPLVLAKNALGVIDGERKVMRFIKGEELVGLSYETFLPFLSVQKDLAHRIVAWEDVAADEGSGVVHIAPGCGAEDYDLGKREHLAEICPVDEDGRFTSIYGFLSGKAASEVAKLIFESLDKQHKLYKTHQYTHSYPVCWRCKTEVLFRLVDSWVIKTEDIRPKLLSAAEGVKWNPQYSGKRMRDWLTNMGDWNISRKRFYGLPLPFYRCENCGHLTVIGSRQELRDLGGEKVDALPELHRPWIDEITITCPKCGEPVSRVPEVGDVWLDAGITPFSTLGYFTDRKEWEKWFPVEWVVEMNEQIRLWFYSLLFMSVTLTGKAPYEQVITHASVVQEDGSRFHKSGYMIRFDEAAEKIGSDSIRYLFAGASMANDVRFGYTLGEEARRKLLGLWNIYTFFMTYAEIDTPSVDEQTSDNLMDKWLLNRTAAFVNKASKCYESYNTPELIREFEVCVDEVSNWYVRANRRRFWKDRLDTDKQCAYNTLYHAIKTISQVMAPVVPFITEHIWQSMVLKYGTDVESIHLSTFPAVNDYDAPVLDEAQKVRTVIAQALKLRNDKKIKVRQPLSVLYLSKDLEPMCSKYASIILDELNIKRIDYLDDFDSLSQKYLVLNFQVAGRQLKGDLNKVKALCDNLTSAEQKEYINRFNTGLPLQMEGYNHNLPVECFSLQVKEKENIAKSKDGLLVAINTEITSQLEAEGVYREILRCCQLLRKEAGFALSDRVILCFVSESDYIKSILKTFEYDLTQETLSYIQYIQSPIMKKMLHFDKGMVEIFIA